MNNASPSPTVARDNRKGRARDLPTDKQLTVFTFLADEAAVNDTELENAIVITVAGMKDKSIQPEVGQELLIHLFTAFRNNDHMHDVIAMLRANSVAVPLEEVERIEALRRKAAKK